MAFTVAGTKDGRPVTLEWRDGDLSGDEAAVAEARRLVERGAEVSLVPSEPGGPARLDDAVGAMAVIQAVLDEVSDLDGDYPMPSGDEAAT